MILKSRAVFLLPLLTSWEHPFISKVWVRSVLEKEKGKNSSFAPHYLPPSIPARALYVCSRLSILQNNHLGIESTESNRTSMYGSIGTQTHPSGAPRKVYVPGAFFRVPQGHSVSRSLSNLHIPIPMCLGSTQPVFSSYIISPVEECC